MVHAHTRILFSYARTPSSPGTAAPVLAFERIVCGALRDILAVAPIGRVVCGSLTILVRVGCARTALINDACCGACSSCVCVCVSSVAGREGRADGGECPQPCEEQAHAGHHRGRRPLRRGLQQRLPTPALRRRPSLPVRRLPLPLPHLSIPNQRRRRSSLTLTGRSRRPKGHRLSSRCP